MSASAYLLLGLTAIVGALAGVLAFALLRLGEAARRARRGLAESGAETAFMAAALEEAVGRLRAQERAMQARAEASERLSGEIVASMTSGLLVVNQAREVRMLNPAGQRLLGLSPERSTGPLRDVLRAAEPLAAAIEECLDRREPIVRRTLALARGSSGAVSHVGVTVSPVTDGRGEFHGAICLFTDLTAVVELEEQLRLKDSLARLGELTAGLAHEFRNGLATIHGYARLFDLDALPPAYRPYVEGIRHETEALRQVVTNFLNFARPAELALGPVDLAAVVERAAEEIRAEARSRGGDATVAGEFATIEGDEVLLRQAFSNLCRNAVEACVAAGLAPVVEVRGTVDRAQGVVRVTVTDNGPGIDPAVADRLFRPFVTTRPRGSGLGLAIVQKIVVTHNGRVTAGPAPGGGARFQVVLPLPEASRRVPERNSGTAPT
jgi:two-component system sensor histidine kinase HydH